MAICPHFAKTFNYLFFSKSECIYVIDYIEADQNTKFSRKIQSQ